MTTIMEKEIFSQPEVLPVAYRENLAPVHALAKEIKERRISQILVAARGSSNNAALYFKYLCEITVGLPVNFIYPSIITQYRGKLNIKNACVIGVSQSGKALDVITVLEEGKAQGSLTAAVTNYPDSPLARAAEHRMYLNVGEERALAATKTFSAQMLVLYMLVAALENTDSMPDAAIPPVAELIEKTLESRDSVSAVADKYTGSSELIILARGLNLSVANEIALKLQETCYINARGYSISDFHHGPFALVNKKSQILIIAVTDHVYDDAVQMIEKILPTGADITVLTDKPELYGRFGGLLLPHAPERLMPFAAASAGQLMSCLLSVKRGIDPDKPRGLSKVTVTK